MALGTGLVDIDTDPQVSLLDLAFLRLAEGESGEKTGSGEDDRNDEGDLISMFYIFGWTIVTRLQLAEGFIYIYPVEALSIR